MKAMTSRLKTRAMRVFLLIFFCLLVKVSFSQSAQSLFEDGNKAYTAGQFAKAQSLYEQSMALDKENKFVQANFNLANALFQQKKYDEAAKQYQSFIEKSSDEGWKEQGYYNLANTFLAKQDYPSAIKTYQQALRLNPRDEDARYNLALTIQLSGGQANRTSSTSTQKNQRNTPQSRPLTEEEKRQLLQHLSDLENKTVQELDQTKSVRRKKSVKDW